MLERLLDIGKAVMAESDVDRVLSTALDGLIALCEAERGMILLFGSDGEIVFEQARNLEKEDIDRPHFQVSRSVIDSVRAKGEGCWHANVLSDSPFSRKESVRRLGILSIICQPIRHDGKDFGVVYLDQRSEERVLTEEHFDLVVHFSDFVSLAAHNALDRRRLKEQIRELRDRWDFKHIVSHDPKMVDVLRLVAQVAASSAPILIRGETGTGKELIAKAIHANSTRRDGRFVPVNCGALPENLLEAELFGHAKGAFTGAHRDRPGWFDRAQGGTILLDEVGELSPALQVKLLRILENGEYSRVGSTETRRSDARVVAATNRDLSDLVQTGGMRQDFYFRLNVVEVEIPPLRERRSDVPVLLRHFLDSLNKKLSQPKRLSRKAENLLLRHDYPGNVRELKHALERAHLVATDEVIEPEHLPEALRRPTSRPGGIPQGTFKAAKQEVVERFERQYLRRCLEQSSGNIRRAAQLAELDYKNFHSKMSQYGIHPAEFKQRS